MHKLLLISLAVAVASGCSTLPSTHKGSYKPAVIDSLESAPPQDGNVRSIHGRPLTTDDLPNASVIVRIVDVGAGLCIVGKTNDDYSFLIDAGTGNTCSNAVEEMLPDIGLSLVVLTHSDTDHIKALPKIVSRRRIDKLLWTGHRNQECYGKPVKACTQTFQDAVKAIGSAVADGTTVFNLATTTLTPGTLFKLGTLEIEFLEGWHDAPFELPAGAEADNAVSIVSRIKLGNRSILVMGDAVGRPLGGPEGACESSEEWLVMNFQSPTLKSDVLVASHHGADNGTANCLLDAVDPTYVVFSAGAKFKHPRATTAERVLNHGIPISRILRTDRGDDEMPNSKGEGEWIDGLTKRCGDSAGDDDIEVNMTETELTIMHLTEDQCGSI